ncbi:MAG TPA: hypothetical protein PKA70_02360 [Saprospiraceae bacterium]|nr:hypothetical protein [Saprospiraceae bacterium]
MSFGLKPILPVFAHVLRGISRVKNHPSEPGRETTRPSYLGSGRET